MRITTTLSTKYVVGLGLIAVVWGWLTLAMSSRVYFLLPYAVLPSVTPELEPFAASLPAAIVLLTILATWLAGYWHCNRKAARCQHRAFAYLAIGCLPFVPICCRVLDLPNFPPHMVEVLWTGAWTGLSFGELARVFQIHEKTHESGKQAALRTNWLSGRIEMLLVAFISFACAVWWYAQSQHYFQNFMLGYNDFGHFLQRVANTAASRGVLMESPVLPMFWDHFNPGLIALVPLWKLFPTASLVFLLQAFSLAGSSLLIYKIAKRLEHTNASALTFALAWLVQPVVGQMNLAYTYGWHPITCAIPLLLLALHALISERYVVSILATLAAMTLEEGVFVIVGLFAATCLGMRISNYSKLLKHLRSTSQSDGRVLGKVSAVAWAATALICFVGFWMVYRFSGLAEFQTGRFVSLGNSPLEIVVSPILRPTAFWGQALRVENLIFIAALWLPCGLASLWQGWRWLLPTLLPLGVLIVWDHRPAHSLAFQYTSTLLPLFWLASLTGATRSRDAGSTSVSPNALPQAVTALATGLVLSVFLGQFPHSAPTLFDVATITYDKSSPWQREHNSEDGLWLHKQLQAIRASETECLATGRIAAHLVGNRDVETVGQYLERRERLSQLPDRLDKPLLHYQWLVLDRREQFQQKQAQTAEVEREALDAGFVITADEFDIVILQRHAER